MTLLPNEETLKSPLPNMVITTRRLRYMPNENFLQTMSLREISYIGIIKKEDRLYKIMAYVFTVLAIMGAGAMVMGEPMGNLVLMGCGLAGIVFYLLYLGSRQTTLQTESRGGAKITVVLSNKNITAAREIMETVESAKLTLESGDFEDEEVI